MNDPTRPELVVPPRAPSMAARLLALAALFVLVAGTTAAWATDAPADDGADPATTEVEGDPPADPAADPAAEAEDDAYNQLLLTGADVYGAVCSACHQPGGAGLSGQFPPLNGNPNVEDAQYVADTIANGKQGELTVLGETYNGVMPAFATLPDAEVDAVIAYIQSGFVTPITENTPAPGDTGPVAGTELPGLTNMTMYAAFAIAIAGGAIALAPRVVDANDRLDFPWLDAWLRTALIVVAVVFFVVYIPSWALQTETVGKLGDFGQQLIGVSLWMVGLCVVLGALWYAHKEDRI